MNKLLTIALMFKVLDQATAPVRKINDTVGNTGQKLENAAGKSTQLKNGIDRIGTAASAAANKLDVLNKKTEKFAQAAEKLDGLGRPLAASGAVSTIGIEKALSAYSDLEAAQTSLRVAMMEKGGVVNLQDFTGLSALAQKLGKDYMGSSEDFYKMFRILTEQGIKQRDILAGTGKAVADFAAVTGESYDGAALKIAKFQDSFGIAANDMVTFANQASKAKFAFGMDTTEIFYAMPYLGGALKQLNLQGIGASESVLRLMGTLNQAGLPATQVGESVNQMINRMADFDNRLGKKSKAMKEIRETLNGTGINLEFWDKAGKFGGFENMISQFEKLKPLSEQMRIKVGKNLFGDVGGKAVSILAMKGLVGWKESEEAMKKQASLGERVAAIQQNLAFKWDSFTGTVKGLVAVTGEAINNVTGLKSVLDVLNDSFDAGKNWVLLHPKTAGLIAGVIVTVAGLSLAGGALLITVAALGTAWPRALEGLTMLGKGAAWATGRFTALYLSMRGMNAVPVQRGMFGEIIGTAPVARSKILTTVAAMKAWTATQLLAFRTNFLTIAGLKGLAAACGSHLLSGIRLVTTAMRALSLSMLLNPVGLAIAGIAAGALLIIAYWKPIKAFMGGVWQGFKEGLLPLKELFKSIWVVAKPIRDIFTPLIGIIKQFLTPLDFTNKTLSSVAFWGKFVGYALSMAFTAPVFALVGFLKLVKKLFTDTKQFFAGGWNIAKSVGAGIMANLNPIVAMKKVMEKIRAFLPFSPAKEGPLRDIHRVRLIETIAESIKPHSLVNAVRGATAAAMLAAVPLPLHAAPGVNPSVQTQLVRQSFIAAQLPQLPQQTQQINQQLNPVKLPLLATRTQQVNQALQPVLIPPLALRTQRINQQLNPVKMAALPDLTQRINQVLSPAEAAAPHSLQRPALPVADLARSAAQPGSSGNMTVHFSPQITIQGGGDPAQINSQVNQAMTLSFAEFERHMQRFEAQRSRRAF